MAFARILHRYFWACFSPMRNKTSFLLVCKFMFSVIIGLVFFILSARQMTIVADLWPLVIYEVEPAKPLWYHDVCTPLAILIIFVRFYFKWNFVSRLPPTSEQFMLFDGNYMLFGLLISQFSVLIFSMLLVCYRPCLVHTIFMVISRKTYLQSMY